MKKDEELETKKEKIKPILEELEDLLEYSFVEAKEFISKLDDEYWTDNFSSLAIIEKLSYYFREMDDYDLDEFIPEIFWNNRKNALDAFDIIAESECFNVGAYVPSYLWEDENAALYIVSKEYSGLGYISDKLTNYKKIVFYALSNLEDKIRESYYNFPALPWDRNQHLEWFMEEVSKSLKNDKDFILELLDYDYFSDEFDIIYNWIDASLWNDKDFVRKVVKVDIDNLNRMSDELKADGSFLEEIANTLEEDLEYIKELIL
jgi:hypothetical protein